VPAPEQIHLRNYESPTAEVSVIDARSRAHAVAWGFAALITTVALGLIAYVALDVANSRRTRCANGSKRQLPARLDYSQAYSVRVIVLKFR